MIVPVNLLDINLPLFLSGIGGLTLIILLLILFLVNLRKRKSLNIENKLLSTEIEKIRSTLKQTNALSEKEITNKIEELKEEIENQKAVELEQKVALKRAEQASFLKNAFWANMSLEIRTPLNGIIGFSHLLLGKVEYQEKPELVDFAKGIAESSDRLLVLMEHIIDLSRIDANDYEIKIKPFEINTVIGRCVDRVKNTAFEKGLIIDYKQEAIYSVKGDKAAFEKSVDLILDNAIKYTPKGKITLSLQVDKNKLHILISDTGIGIDKNFLSSIFEAFRQKSTGYSRIHQGAGLGLPLAQKLMTLMQGEIELKSEKGKGTDVALILTLDAPEKQVTSVLQSSEKEDSKVETSSGKPSIFIVEDDKMNRMLFEKMLSNYADIQIAIDGDDAFLQLKKAMQTKSSFDVILLDINLPNPWDGMQLLVEFKKKWPTLNKIPFIAQTAYAISGDKEKFLAVGFDDYISKPIDKKELLTIIENNMRKFNALNS